MKNLDSMIQKAYFKISLTYLQEFKKLSILQKKFIVGMKETDIHLKNIANLMMK